MEEIVPQVIDHVVETIRQNPSSVQFMENPLAIVESTVQIFDDGIDPRTLLQPSDPSDAIQCCACGKRMKSFGSKAKNEERYRWYAEKLPPGVPGNKFSNSLPGGNLSKPVRMVCDACMWRVFLDRILARVSGKSLSSWYPVFYIPDGFPISMIRSFQAEIERFKQANPDAKAFMIDPGDLDDFGIIGHLSLETRKGFGFAIPSIPGEICCSIPLDWHIDNDGTASDQFLDMAINVLAVSMKTGTKVAITKLRNDYYDMINDGDIFFQELPMEFDWLTGNHATMTRDRALLFGKAITTAKDIARAVTGETGSGTRSISHVAISILDECKRGEESVLHYLAPLRKESKKTGDKDWSMALDVLSKLHELQQLKIQMNNTR